MPRTLRRAIGIAAIITGGALAVATPANAQTDGFVPVTCDACEDDNASGGDGTGFFLVSLCSVAQDGTGMIEVRFTSHESVDTVATVNGQSEHIGPFGKWTFYVPTIPGAVTLISRSVVALTPSSDGTEVRSVIVHKEREYPCACTQVTQTAPPTTIPPDTTVPSPSTTGPPNSSPPSSAGAATTVPFRLPDTGGTPWGKFIAGATILGLGIIAVAGTRRRPALDG